ncbi:hypothetical protein, partial [Selenomonas sp. GACV-9]|uniref:hypothetical protein n=1 Tax=Selenomonas sp. GACV-9 TaxID=3158782 RepID=UPI001C43554B
RYVGTNLFLSGDRPRITSMCLLREQRFVQIQPFVTQGANGVVLLSVWSDCPAQQDWAVSA